jgi:CHAT domain-containing protein/Tfp pilus assembly protein PilF
MDSQAQDFNEAADSLLINSEYTQVVALIDQVTSDNALVQSSLLLNKKVEALIYLGKYEEAERILKQIKTENNKFNQAVTLSNFGLLYLYQGRNDLALETLKESVTLFESESRSNTLEAAQCLSTLGLAYKSTGKNVQAEEQLQMALNIRQSILKGNHELIASSYNNLGFAYSLIDNDKALDFYEKALKIYSALHGKDHPKIAITSINIGIVYQNLELYGDAVNNFENALKIWEKVYPGAHPTKAFALQNLGNVYSKIGDQKATKGYYERALSLYKEVYKDKHPDIARVLNAIGNIELSNNNYNVAIKHYQEGLIANVSNFNDGHESANPGLRNYYHGNVLLYSLLYKAEAFEKRYLGKTIRFSDLSNSLSILQRCDSLIDQLRQQTTNESDKIGLGAIANEVYADGVRIAVEAAQNALQKKKYLELAFYFAEKSKSAVLLEAISDSDAKSFSGIPAQLLEEEKNLKSAIALTAQKLSQKPTTEEEKYLRETAYSLNRSYETFTKKLEIEYPQYFNLKFNAASPSIEQIQKSLGVNSALISYFIDEANSRLYILSITNTNFTVTDRALPKQFDKYITGLRNSLYFNAYNTYIVSSQKLSKLLLPRLPSGIKDLVILPTGRMSIIPFETLLLKEAETTDNFKSVSYLINKYNIRYEFSASLLLQKTKSKSTQNGSSILLCAPVDFPATENLSALPGTESEVKEISQLFASKNLQADINIKSQASEAMIKKPAIKDYSMLHFATHGVVDESNPELSRIFLQSDTDAEDGNLYSGEIYNLALNANLVTLSACQTGLGKISKGEGVIGLSRALVYAGAKNIIVSFWSVADESTAVLMKDFYKTLLHQGTSNYTESLRTAKLNMIKSEKYSAPYYWAPFILIGF